QGGASVAKGLFAQIGPEGAAALRLLLGAAMLLALMRPWRNWPRDAPLAPLIGLGVSTGFTIVMFYLALSPGPQGGAIAPQFLGPLVVAIAISKRASDFLWAGLAALGVWLLVGAGRVGLAIDPIGALFALGAATGWGAYILLGRAASAAFGGATA